MPLAGSIPAADFVGLAAQDYDDSMVRCCVCLLVERACLGVTAERLDKVAS